MMAAWQPWWDVLAGGKTWWDVLAVGTVGTVATVAVLLVAARRRQRRNVRRTLSAAGLTGGPVTGHLLRRRERPHYWRVQLSDGRRSRRYVTLHGATAYLRRHARPSRDVTGVGTGRLTWDPPTVTRVHDTGKEPHSR